MIVPQQSSGDELRKRLALFAAVYLAKKKQIFVVFIPSKTGLLNNVSD